MAPEPPAGAPRRAAPRRSIARRFARHDPTPTSPLPETPAARRLPAARPAPPRPAPPASPGQPQAYAATLPAAAFKAGDLVRWAVVATGANGLATRRPDPAAREGGYEGTAIAAPPPAGALPALYW
jgi:hypothetical protein